MFEASAPAKVILFGEHAVVYGQPAIAVPVSGLRATATFYESAERGLRIKAVDMGEVLPVMIDSELVDNALILTAQKVLRTLSANPPDAMIELRSTIPMASGLGSGAAVSTAIARALLGGMRLTLNIDELNAIIYEVEKIYHGTPSGIDNTVVVYEQPVYFVKDQPLQLLSVQKPFTIVIADTGQASLTRVAVGDVRQLYEQQSARILPIIKRIGHIAQQAQTALKSGDLDELGPLMDENHRLLQELTVSSPELDQLVVVARNAGAIGAKLSGGGRGGNMIALVTSGNAEAIKQALLRAGAVRVFISEVGSC